MTFSTMIISIGYRYAECSNYLNDMLSVIMLNVVMLSIVAPMNVFSLVMFLISEMLMKPGACSIKLFYGQNSYR
jgi:hypothetical protein